jgi:hypothetical protein
MKMLLTMHTLLPDRAAYVPLSTIAIACGAK